MVKIVVKELIKSQFKTDKLISCSLFRQLKVDKDPIKYYNWLRDFIKEINKNYSDFKIRLYTDLSLTYNEDGSIYKEGIKLLNELKQNPKVEVFMYRCDDFALNKYYHQGTFGTLVRLLPLFNKNKYKLVWISDIDFDEVKEYEKYITLFKKNDCELLVNSRVCYPKPWISKKNKFNIMAGIIFSKIKYPKKLLFDFLTDIKEGKYNKVIKEISTTRRTADKDTIMPYGIDEYFTNTVFNNYILKHKVKIMVMNDISIIALSRKLYYSNIIKKTYRSKKELIKMSKMLLKDKKELIKKHPNVDKRYFTTCPQQYIDNIDKVDKNNIYISFF